MEFKKIHFHRFDKKDNMYMYVGENLINISNGLFFPCAGSRYKCSINITCNEIMELV